MSPPPCSPSTFHHFRFQTSHDSHLGRGESMWPISHIPRHAPLVCIVIDLQAIPPRPGANPHYPHLAQHLISTLNQPDNFKKRTREKAIYPAHCRAAKP